MKGQIILMVVFGREEFLAGLDLGDDRRVERMRLVELTDIGLGDLCLFRIEGEDRRAVLGADVRALAVQFGRIVRHREINLQNAAVADLPRIIGNAYRLRVTGAARTYGFVLRGLFVTARITRYRVGDAL